MGGDFVFGEVAGAAGVLGWELGGDLGFAFGFEIFGGFEGAVGPAVSKKDLGVLTVDFGAFGLAVRAEGAADVGAFVPGETDPAEGVEDHLLGGGDKAGAVGVFDAEDELAGALFGEDEVEQANVGSADVRVAGGGRSDADAGGGGCGEGGFGHEDGSGPMVAGEVGQSERYCGPGAVARPTAESAQP